jgi:hypothetical protein
MPHPPSQPSPFFLVGGHRFDFNQYAILSSTRLFSASVAVRAMVAPYPRIVVILEWTLSQSEQNAAISETHV